jgi:hypothetical protein
MRTHGSHEFDAAAGSGERQRPDRILSCQTNYIIQFSGKKTFALLAFRHINYADIGFPRLID